MEAATKSDLAAYCAGVAQRAKQAGAQLSVTAGATKVAWLKKSAAVLRASQVELAAANAKDLEAAPGYGLTDAQVDRLRLTAERVEAMAIGLEEVASLGEPIGTLIQSTIRPNGLQVNKVRVPLGVIFFIYESRPNVTVDAAAP